MLFQVYTHSLWEEGSFSLVGLLDLVQPQGHTITLHRVLSTALPLGPFPGTNMLSALTNKLGSAHPAIRRIKRKSSDLIFSEIPPGEHSGCELGVYFSGARRKYGFHTSLRALYVPCLDFSDNAVDLKVTVTITASNSQQFITQGVLPAKFDPAGKSIATIIQSLWSLRGDGLASLTLPSPKLAKLLLEELATRQVIASDSKVLMQHLRSTQTSVYLARANTAFQVSLTFEKL